MRHQFRCQPTFRSALVAKPLGMLIGGVQLLTCLSVFSGCAASLEATCAPYMEHKRRAIVTFQARSEAKHLWAKCHADQYPSGGDVADARHGYVTGYVETALGYVDSPPPVPPRPLFSLHTLLHTYPNANAWYEGYHQGSAMALSRGVHLRRLASLDPDLLHSQFEYPTMGQASELTEGELLHGRLMQGQAVNAVSAFRQHSDQIQYDENNQYNLPSESIDQSQRDVLIQQNEANRYQQAIPRNEPPVELPPQEEPIPMIQSPSDIKNFPERSTTS